MAGELVTFFDAEGFRHCCSAIIFLSFHLTGMTASVVKPMNLHTIAVDLVIAACALLMMVGV